MTEKWIQSYGSEVDAFSDYRRTGYPVLFNPNDATMAPNGLVQPPVNGNPRSRPPAANCAGPAERPHPTCFPWYQIELETNQTRRRKRPDQ